jgi:tRNA G18 (ribose-2'-O)-methylase SpoU
VVRNATGSTLQQLNIQTDIGEAHTLDRIAVNESRRILLSKREKALWIVATTSTGETLKSKQIYVTSEGTVFAVVFEDSITTDYEL